MVKKILPSLKDLEQVGGIIKKMPNRQGEFLRGVHYGCYLLCFESGLRISEAVKFDLNAKTRKGLYRIEKSKGKKERYVYVPKKVIRELETNHWQPNQTNRHNFYHFLWKIKQKANINQNVELTPHNLRRAFTTYHAEAGLPLPLLSKLLGHSSIRTTALYWQNIYGDDDPNNILAGKKWLESKEKELLRPPTENFPEIPKNPEPIFIDQKPVIPAKKPIQQGNSLLLTEIREKPITNYQPKSVISEIPLKSQEKHSLNITNQRKEISEQLPPITNESQKENILLAKIKNLEEQLKQIQTENSNLKTLVQSEKQNNQFLKEANTNLTHKIQADEKNHTNLINAYQKALNDKARAEKQVNYYQEQLKTLAKALYQWQKIKHYQQIEQEAKVEQPLPFRPNK